MVMAQSLFITLKTNNPNCQIDVLAPAWSFALLDRMPEVSNAHVMPLMHGQFRFNQRRQIGKDLRLEHYDQSIVLPNSWKSALIPYFADIPQRTGYVGEVRWGLLNDARKLNKALLTMTVQRFVALGLKDNKTQAPTYSIPHLKINKAEQQSTINKFNVSLSNKILALCPGAEYGDAKRWPIEHFAELAKNKQADGWDVWIFGSDKDKAVATQINQLSDDICHDFTGKTTMAEAIDLMALTHTVVSNDSGLMHVAAALNKPLIALYGSSDPAFTPPLNDAATIINRNLNCSPCFKRVCPLEHTDCLAQISAQHVQAHIH